MFDEFKFLTQTEMVRALETGAELWMILKKIHNTGCNRQIDENQSQYLKNQFDQAHEFLIETIRRHSSQNQGIFDGVLKKLGEGKGGQRK